jgi:hypothetical protein
LVQKNNWHFRTYGTPVDANAAIAKMSDETVAEMVQQILDLHDAVMDATGPYPFQK